MFCQQAKPRAGVAKFLSDGEEIFVTDSAGPKTSIEGFVSFSPMI